jgi:rhomboid family GlyGly-CTERM serine protease
MRLSLRVQRNGADDNKALVYKYFRYILLMSEVSLDSRSSRTQGASAWLLGLLCAVVVLLSLSGESTTLALRYEREAVLSGQYWRLLTAHLVHGSVRHLLLNLAGLGLIATLFSRDFRALQWIWIWAVSTLAIDVGFVWFEPQLTWYVGLSGVLHGLLAAGAIVWWRSEPTPLAAALSVILIGKLAWEQTHGALPLSGDLPVVVNAHLYGAIGGTLAALSMWVFSRFHSRK